jgi:hypothetical protein
MTIHKKIDTSKLAEADSEHLTAVIGSKNVPDAVKRFCTSALFPDDPELAELVKAVRDVAAFEAFAAKCAAQMMRAASFAELTCTPPPSPERHFGAWFVRLLRVHLDIVPDGEMKSRMLAVVAPTSLIEEVDCDCEVCRHRPPPHACN